MQRSDERKGRLTIAPRRAGAGVAFAAALALLLPGVLAGAGPARTLADGPADPWGLRERFRDFELQVMDPFVHRALLADGEIDLTLRGRTYPLVVEREAWADAFTVVEVDPDGTTRARPFAFQPEAHVGRVAGEPGSFAVVVVTGSGVMGRVRTADADVHFQPVQFVRDAAPPGISVVHLAQDEVPLPLDDGHLGPITEEGAPTERPLPGLGSSSYAPGPNRSLTLWVDPNMTAAVSSWANRITSEFGLMNPHWRAMLGFEFTHLNGAVYVCNACTADTTGDLLQQFGNAVNVQNQPWSAYEVAFLYTGSNTPNAGGAAYQPGRYGYVQGTMGDASWRVRAMAHELGHAFNAWHSRGEAYTHTHAGGAAFTHYTMMTGGAAQNQESPLEFSSLNANWIRACNLHSWTGGSRTPGWLSGFGDRCWNGVQVVQNGGEGPSFDAASWRGKLFTNVPPGDVRKVCIYAQAGNTAATVAVKPSADASAPTFTVEVAATAPGWNCAETSDRFWTSSTLFAYKTAGNAAIGFDAGAPADGRSSANGGASWQAENVRRGFRVEVLRSALPVESCGVLGSGASLAVHGSFASCNGQYLLAHQGDGNVVLYRGTQAHWATGTSGATTGLVMQSDGNLVLYNGGTVRWASNTDGNPGAWLSVRDDGLLAIYSAAGKTLWFQGCGILPPDSTLARGLHVKSCDNRFTLAHQGDGNVVLYHGTTPLWATNTAGQATTGFSMQGDGNLVLYNGFSALWASGTAGNPGSRLVVQDDGDVVVKNRTRDVVWRTNTGGR